MNHRTIANPCRARRGGKNTRLVVLLALLAVLFAVGAWVFLTREGPKTVPPSQVYQKLIDHGFVPEFVCTTEPEFVRTVRERFGTGLGLREEPAGLEILGWAYGDAYEGRVVGDRTLILMARINTHPTLVLIDHLRDDRKIEDPAALMGNWTGGDIKALSGRGTPPPDGTPADPSKPMGNWVGGDISAMSLPDTPRADGRLSIFRAQAGALVLYEVTPLERPGLLGLLVEK
ncbi:MAG: hypothetical protein KF869_03350 [Phycisphaeraceae bacterium]|nr:hypothetical protein [Phycisphaeraceae bacterium]